MTTPIESIIRAIERFAVLSSIFGVFAFGWSVTVIADAGENAFRAALGYTVQIKTSIQRPIDFEPSGTGQGAGFVVDVERGWIMTNAHVVGRSPSRVAVSFRDQPFIPAQKVYVDPYLDVAIISVGDEAKKLATKAAKLECKTMPSVGHPVGAFGHPGNQPYTGTRGVISGNNVEKTSQTESLQTDAAVNPGNSGGPLISFETGKVVGINTAQLKNAQNTNFAVAMVYACRILELLQQGKDPSPPHLPVSWFADANDRTVLRVAKMAIPGDRLPLQIGDTITGISGIAESISSKAQLIHHLRGNLDNIKLFVRRNERKLIVSGSLGPEPPVMAGRGISASGMVISPVPNLFKAEPLLGPLVVTHVEPGEDAQFQGVMPFDSLVSINGIPVTSIDECHAILSRAGSQSQPAQLIFKRLSVEQFLASAYREIHLSVTQLSWVAQSP